MNKKPTIFQLIIASLLILVIALQLTRQVATGVEANAETGHKQELEGDHHNHDHHGHEHDGDHDSHHEGHSHDDHDHHGHGHHHHHGHTEDETLWSISKAEILRQTMITYRPAKQGQYKEYWVGKGLEWQGVALPDKAVTNIGQPPLETLVDGKPQALQYSQTAEEEGWKVVAIFSNQADQAASEHHTYLFIIKEDGQALVLEPVAKDDKTISFSSQVDDKLIAAFAQVVTRT